MLYPRQDKLKNELKKRKLGAYLITNQTNIFYLTGLKTEDSTLLATRNKYFFITDSRFKEESEEAFSGCRNIEVKIETYKRTKKDIIKELVIEQRIKEIGFEPKSLSFFAYQGLKRSLLKKAAFLPVSRLIEPLRLIKDDNEIKLIRQAIKITTQAFLYLRKQLKPGRKEIDLAREVEHFIRLKGAYSAAFDLIIASGKRSSKPHSPVSDNRITNNQVVLADMGVNFHNYNSDLTRTFSLGKIPSNLKKIKEIVIEAQKRAISAIRPGVEISLLDKTARNYIASQGYGEYFIHSLGHGVGLQVHESPAVNSFNSQKLEPGMVFTLEPGIYLPSYGGIRIEDIALVTKKGCVILSDGLNQSI